MAAHQWLKSWFSGFRTSQKPLHTRTACARRRLIWIELLESRDCPSASIWTDQLDYAPGSTATIFGSGFQASEAIELSVVHLDSVYQNQYEPWIVTDGDTTPAYTDGNGVLHLPDLDGAVDGNFQTTWQVGNIPGSTLEATATGLTSGEIATTTFTDALNFQSLSVGAQTGVLAAGTAGSATYTVSVGFNGSGTNSVTLSISFTGGTPSGVTSSFSPNPVNGTNNIVYTSTLTINTTASTPAGSFSFTVTGTPTTGSARTASGTLLIGPDTTPPNAPSIPSAEDNVGSITGTLTSGARTDDTDLAVRVNLTGTGALSGNTVRLYNGAGIGSPLGSAYSLTTGDISNGYAYVQTGTLTEGTYNLTARITDAASNQSAASSPVFTVTIDTTAPGIPSITSVTDDVPPQTGTVPDGGSTNDTQPTIRVSLVGTGALTGDTVYLYHDAPGAPDDRTSSYVLTLTDVSNTYADIQTTPLVAGVTYSTKARLVDVAGNIGSLSSAVTFTIDTTSPSVGITDDETGVANIAGGTVIFTFTFSEPVYGFTASDVVVTGGVPGTFTGSDGDTVFTLSVTPSANSTTDITVDVGAGVATDAAGNPNTAATQAVQAVDTVKPTVGITDDETGVANIAGGAVIFTFTFSEPVYGFTASDVVVTGGSPGTFTGSDGDTVFTLSVTPSANSTTDITVDVGAGVATDAAGNPNTAATQAVQAVDTLRPTVVVALSDTSLTAGETATVTFTFNEKVTGFSNALLTVPNGTLTAVSSSDGGKTWTATYTPTPGVVDATNVITVDLTGVADLAGNAGVGTTNSPNFAIDTKATKLLFKTQPVPTVLANQSLNPITVQVADAANNSVSVAGKRVTLVIRNSAGKVVKTLSALTLPDGSVTFTNLKVLVPGRYRLEVTCTGLTKAISNIFQVLPNKVLNTDIRIG